MAYNDAITRTDAEALIPEEVSNEILKAAPQASAALRLFRRGPNMSRKQYRMPVLNALADAYFVSGDTGLKQTTKLAWANKYLYAEELAVIVPIPEAVLDDSAFDIWGEVRPAIVEAFGVALDAAIFFGTDKPATWPDAIYTGCVSASQTYNHGSVADLDIVDEIGGSTGLMAMIEADGFDVNGFVADISVKSLLRNARAATGELIYQPSLTAGTPSTLYGQPVQYPMNGAWAAATALMICGDFTQGIIAMRQDITWKILSEATLTDAQGNVVYNLAQQDMVALRAVMRVAFQIANPINRMNQTAATRYPWAAMTP